MLPVVVVLAFESYLLPKTFLNRNFQLLLPPRHCPLQFPSLQSVLKEAISDLLCFVKSFALAYCAAPHAPGAAPPLRSTPRNVSLRAAASSVLRLLPPPLRCFWRERMNGGGALPLAASPPPPPPLLGVRAVDSVKPYFVF